MSERRRGFSLRRQLISLAPLGAVWMVGLAVLAAARLQTATPLEFLFLDPAHLTGTPWYTGALSNLGILVWTCGVTVAAAGAWVAGRTERAGAARFLAFGALATAVMLLDDVFAFHSGLLKNTVGIPKTIAQAMVVTPTIVWFLAFQADIRRTRSALLLAGLGSFAGSVLVDAGLGLTGDTALLVEDGLKFLGILAWAQYFAITARDIAASTINEALRRSAQDRGGGAATTPAEAPPSPTELVVPS